MIQDNLPKEYIVISESSASSILKDMVTFGSMGLLLWFNHSALDGNGWLDAAFILMVVMFMIGRNSNQVRRFYSKEDAINYLRDENKFY